MVLGASEPLQIRKNARSELIPSANTTNQHSYSCFIDREKLSARVVPNMLGWCGCLYRVARLGLPNYRLLPYTVLYTICDE